MRLEKMEVVADGEYRMILRPLPSMRRYLLHLMMNRCWNNQVVLVYYQPTMRVTILVDDSDADKDYSLSSESTSDSSSTSSEEVTNQSEMEKKT
ncbi:hypothetical protein JTB14_028242 [Gonioctena quinquepunctata]|nr:hypothetical protein JTB14_028242 [Gonioctena quinquepunctata]